MQRFPTRTLVLMGLALVSFMWMWWNTHRLAAAQQAAAQPQPASLQMLVLDPVDGGTP